jgi:ankyrin repeat protein
MSNANGLVQYDRPMRDSERLRDLDRKLRSIPGARTETRTLGEVFEREIAWLFDAHRTRSPAAAILLRHAGWRFGHQDPSDASILDSTLDEAHARNAIAKFHWFASHDDATKRAGEPVDPRFEAAADAIVDGDAPALRALLTSHPDLARARSPYAHHATLLQHVTANGIETSRQWQSPKNAVEIARILIDAGSEVDATCDAYGGSTAMGLLVSSAHPAEAGVQVALVETLLDAGSAIEGIATDKGTPIETAVVFGYPDAAEALARRGARIDDVVVAAGLGRVELIARLAKRPGARLDQAFRVASGLGRTQTALAALDNGADPTQQDAEGFTGLHLAAFMGHLDTVEALLDRANVRAVLEVKNIYGGTVLDGTVWAARNVQTHIERLPVIRKLIAAGANIAAVGPRPVSIPAIEALLAAGILNRA